LVLNTTNKYFVILSVSFAQLNMAVIDARSIHIEISTLPGEFQSKLRLNYHGQSYDLVQAFADQKLDLAQQRWQQLVAADPARGSVPDRYLLVKEASYYSLWALASHQSLVSPAIAPKCDLALQQASIWLLQELWLQCQDLLGTRQLPAFAENLLAATNQLQSRSDLDRLLSLKPLTSAKLTAWVDADFIAFDRQLYQLTQKKIGHQLATNITLDIIESMPAALRSILLEILDIQPK
jgi:hypothetical protein